METEVIQTLTLTSFLEAVKVATAERVVSNGRVLDSYSVDQTDSSFAVLSSLGLRCDLDRTDPLNSTTMATRHLEYPLTQQERSPHGQKLD
jgi:hypothetical protein